MYYICVEGFPINTLTFKTCNTMKKTSVLLMSTLLSVPCVESVAQTPLQPNPTSIARPFLLDSTVRTRYYELVASIAEQQSSIYDTVESITPELMFFDHLRYDSLAYVELIFAIEEEWDIRLSGQNGCVPVLPTVGDLFNYILTKF